MSQSLSMIEEINEEPDFGSESSSDGEEGQSLVEDLFIIRERQIEENKE